MTDDFLTEGLQNDRYLKALRLADQFDDEIKALLLDFGREMINEHRKLFDSSSDAQASSHINRTSNNGIAFQRIHYPMTGPRAPDDDKTRKLNVHLYWLSPRQYDRTDIDGALRGFGYKIKGADQSADERVVKQTRSQDWSIATSESPYDSNIDFYRHVNSVRDIEEARKTLVSHFSEFGDEYARRGSENS